MINWRYPPPPADQTIILHVFCNEDGTTPKRIEIKFNLGIEDISETDSKLHLSWLLASWNRQYEIGEKTKPKPTRGRDFTIGLYFYTDGRPIEMRSDTGDDELVNKFVLVTKDWLMDTESSLQLTQLEETD